MLRMKFYKLSFGNGNPGFTTFYLYLLSNISCQGIQQGFDVFRSFAIQSSEVLMMTWKYGTHLRVADMNI